MSTVFTTGILIDDLGYIYATSTSGIHKLSPTMELIWYYRTQMFTAPVIHNGTLYCSTRRGQAIALTMDIGRQLWSTKVSEGVGSESKAVGVEDNVMVMSSHGNAEEGGDTAITALNASTGGILWTYAPLSQLWGFVPLFTGHGDVLFQDQIGGVYRLQLATGALIWKSGYSGEWNEPWTEGAAMLGPNGLVYALHSQCSVQLCAPGATGDIRAYNISNGELVWEQRTQTPALTQPLVGRLGWGARAGYSVVVALGSTLDLPPGFLEMLQLPLSPYWKEVAWNYLMSLGNERRWLWRMREVAGQVVAFDAGTGELQWSWEAPPVLGFGAGEDKALWPRAQSQGGEWFCKPSLWSTLTLDAGGSLYVGHASGKIFELRDKNGNGVIDGDWEVSSRDLGFAFARGGPAIGDGMLAVSSCNAVHAFFVAA